MESGLDGERGEGRDDSRVDGTRCLPRRSHHFLLKSEEIPRLMHQKNCNRVQVQKTLTQFCYVCFYLVMPSNYHVPNNFMLGVCLFLFF